MTLVPTRALRPFSITTKSKAEERLAKGAALQGKDAAFYDALYANAAPEDINRYTRPRRFRR